MTISSPTSFHVLSDTRPDDKSLPAFMVSNSRGFLPRAEPVVHLPSEFTPLESVLSRMPIKTADGGAGLLASCTLGETVQAELPDLSWAIEKYKDDLPLMNALYRDYSFLASAYLLEPCESFVPSQSSLMSWLITLSGHGRFMKGEPYGLARDVLPANIAVPIVKVAEMYVYDSCFLLPTKSHGQ